MKIKYFAWLKDYTSKDFEICSDPNINNLENLKKFLLIKYPELEKFINEDLLRFAVNYNYVSENITINAKDEIAIFPPVSGG